MIRQLATLLAGELRQQARQPLALALLLLFPVLVGPVGLASVGAWLASQRSAPGEVRSDGPASALRPAEAGGASTGGDPVLISVDEVLPVAGPPELAAWLRPEDALMAVPDAPLPTEGPLDGAVARVRLESAGPVLSFRSDEARSRSARSRLQRVLERRAWDERAARVVPLGMPGSPDELLVVTTHEVSVPSAPGVDPLGAALPPLILVAVAVAALYTAVDVVTGEKERGTIETLLTSAADRRVVVLAKLLVVSGLTLVAGWVLLGSLWAAELAGVPGVLAFLGGRSLGPHLGVLGAGTSLLSLQVACVCLLIAAYVPDYKSASMIAGPVLLVGTLPAAVSSMPIALEPLLALVPVANVSLLIRDAVGGSLAPGDLALVLGASTVHAGLASAATWWLYSQESTLLGAQDRASRRAQGRHGWDAAGLWVAGVLSLWFFGQTAQALDLVGGMVFTQVVLFGALPVAVVAWLGLPLRSTLSLRAPRPADAALAIVAGGFAPFVGTLVFVLQDPWLPTASVIMEQMGRVVDAEQALPVALLVFAVLPATCEELFFRGAMLGLLRGSLGPAARIVVVSAAFGATHLMAPRILPTAAIGLLATTAVHRSGSLWTGVLIHLLNNGLLVLAGRAGFGGEPGPLPLIALGVAAAVVPVLAMRGTAAR